MNFIIDKLEAVYYNITNEINVSQKIFPSIGAI